jgi:hypothetical protein
MSSARNVCFWCGHDPHAEGTACGQPTYFVKTPCECRGLQEARCTVCGRRIDVVDGLPLHRIPRPAELPVGAAGARWGTEIGLFTLATSDHEARVA